MQVTERGLLVVSVVLVVVGLFLLELWSPTLEYQEFAILSQGTYVEMSGVAKDVSQQSNMTFFDLHTECVIPVVMFSQEEVPRNVRVSGSKEVYEGNVQIVADKVLPNRSEPSFFLEE